ncbi:MAG: translocation/assembly module TamB domain-containing protein [Acidobacteriota bacterium]
MSAESNERADSGDEEPVGAARAAAPRSRRRRLLLVSLACLGALALFASVLVAWLVETERGQRALLDGVASRVQRTLGWQLTVADVDVEWTRGLVRLEGLALGAPGESDPVLALAAVEADLDWAALRRGDVVFESMEFRQPQVDLAARRPGGQGQNPDQTPVPADEAAGAGEFPVDVLDWRVVGGTVRNGPSGGWLAALTVRDLEASGSLVDGAAESRLESGQVILERAADGTELVLDLLGQLRGPLSGPLTLDRLEVEGEAVDLRAAGTLGLVEAQPLRVTFGGRLDPSILAPEVAAGAGVATVEGGLDAPAEEIWVRAELPDFPPGTLKPFLAPELMAWMEAVDRLDLDADLRFAGFRNPETRGDLDIVLRRGAEVLARASATLGDEAAAATADEPATVALRAALLPEATGIAEVEVRLAVSDLGDLAGGELRSAQVDLEKADLKGFAERLGSLWPQLSPVVESVPAGSLRAKATASGALLRPRFEAQLRLETPAAGAASLKASGVLGASGAFDAPAVILDLEALDPAALHGSVPPWASGSWNGTVELTGEAPRIPLRFDLVAETVGEASRQASGVSVRGDFSLPWRGRPLLDRAVTGELAVAVAAGTLVGADRGLSAQELTASVAVDGVLGPGVLGDGLTLAVAAQELRSGDVRASGVDLSAETRGGVARILAGQVQLSTPTVDRLPVEVQGQVGVDAGRLQARGDGRLTLKVGADGDPLKLAADVEVAAGDLALNLSEVALDGALASGRARVAGAVARWALLPGLEALASLPGFEAGATAGGGGETLTLDFELAGFSASGLQSLLEDLGLGAEAATPWPDVEASARGELRLDPTDLAASTGRVEVEALDARLRGRDLVSEAPLRLHLSDRALTLEPARLRFGVHGLEGGGHVKWAREWPADLTAADIDPKSLVEAFDFSASGVVDGRLFEPFLPDARSEGLLGFALDASGTLDSPSARLELRDAGDFSMTLDRPYVTRVASPSAVLRMGQGELIIERADAALNEGALTVRGSIGGDPLGQDIHIDAELAGVRYRLDYGLTVEVGGAASYTSTPAPGKLEASFVVDRGTLRRRIDAGQELLDALLAPPALETGATSSEIGETELAIRIATEDGVRVKNNLADLRVGWAPLQVEGTLAAPRIFGSLDVDPDGRVYAYGQVIRLDRAALVFPGLPSVAPRLDLQVTTSIEDPSLLTPQDQRVLASLAQGGDSGQSLDPANQSSQARDSVASGLTTYFGDQLASRLGNVLGRTQLRYRPLWIFGEADPEARLVVSRDLSRFASVGVAFDLREADEQTYLLEISRLPRLPRFTGTLFSDDEAQLGATFQQQIVFGGTSGRDQETGLEVRKVTVDCPECTAATGRGGVADLARRGVAWRRGKRVAKDSAFDLEVDIAERLRGDGYPGARPTVELVPAGEGRVDISVSVDPGPKVRFDWLGEKPPAARRRTLESLYRSDYSERASLVDIQKTAERVWRSRGHPWPRVLVGVGQEGDGAEAVRTVSIESDPGEAFELTASRFLGVPGEVEAELQNRLSSQQWLSELVAAVDAADERLFGALRALGYPSPRILDRSFDPEGLQPSVTLDPGPRRRVSSVEMVGAPDGERRRLRDLVELKAGAPLIDAEAVASAFAIEKDLRERGYTAARVRLVVEPAAGTCDTSASFDPVASPTGAGGLEFIETAARFEIQAGAQQRLAEIDILGAEVTQERWVERLAGVDQKRGELVNATRIGEARRQLLETRLFGRVQVDVVTDEAGQAVLRIDLEERPRYLLAYGLRWQESEGFGALVDVLDRNAGGRGVGLGLRALWVQDEKSLRLYSRLPKVFNSPVGLEFFLEGFEEEDEGLVSEGFELSAQLRWPLAPKTEFRSYARYRRADVRDERLERDEGTASTPLLGLQVVHDGRDDPLDPRRGYFASVDLSGSEDVVSEGESYLRLLAQFDAFLPVADRLTWAHGVRVGAAEVWSGELPRDVRFFAGGARSLRGYRSRSVGPLEVLEDGSLRAEGGEALLVLHEELRYDFNAAVQAVVFYDLGNVWGDTDDFGDDLLGSVGLGVRYRSPIGLLRLDVAHALDGRPEDEDVEVYVGLGHAF